MRHVLRVFFAPSGHSCTKGFTIVWNSVPKLITAKFLGFVADEKAHKDMLGAKGASGTKPCNCKNVVARMGIPEGNDYLVGLDCSSYDALDYATNDDVWGMVDRLIAAKQAGMSKAEFSKLEQIFGLKYVPTGLLFDVHLRSVIKPIDNFLRGWMHCLVSGGVAGTEMCFFFQEIEKVGVPLERLQDFSALFRFPRSRGKPQAKWFKQELIATDNLRSFASEQLNMVPTLYQFTQKVLVPMNVLPNHVKCFGKLHNIFGIFSLGPHKSMRHLAALRSLIVDHHKLYKGLYMTCKPKYHHLMHVPDNMEYARALLSCWVTERKHKVDKRHACHIFRIFEKKKTVMAALINQQAEEFMSGDCFTPVQMLSVREVTLLGTVWWRSVDACLECGEIRKGDLVYLANGSVCEAVAFWAQPVHGFEVIVMETCPTVTTLLQTHGGR